MMGGDSAYFWRLFFLVVSALQKVQDEVQNETTPITEQGAALQHRGENELQKNKGEGSALPSLLSVPGNGAPDVNHAFTENEWTSVVQTNTRYSSISLTSTLFPQSSITTTAPWMSKPFSFSRAPTSSFFTSSTRIPLQPR